MNNINDKREKKGFLPFLSKIFRGGGSVNGFGSQAAKIAAGGAKGGFFASLFASKAAVVGLVLGAATIAAGIGVIYNYISPSSGHIYTPNLFSNAYYEEAQKQANVERASYSSPNPGSQSSLDVFKEGASKEFKSDEPKEGANSENNSSESSPASNVSGSNSAAPNPDTNPGAGKLNANLGFDAKQAGGSQSSGGTRLQTSGGLWGGIGKPFSPISKNMNSANSGASSKMNKGLTARVVASPKYTVPNINKKGAFGQAKFAANVGKSAAFNASDAGARTTAEQAFSGQTAGSGDVATPIGGSGLGGAGLSQGNKLKANDPSLNQEDYTPPTPNKSDNTPWEKLTDYALYAMLAAGAFIAIANMLAQHAKALAASPVTVGASLAYFQAAMAFAGLALAAAAAVIGIAVVLAAKYKQTMMGMMYGVIGAILAYQAYKALAGASEGYKNAEQMSKDPNVAKFNDFFKGLSEGQKASFGKLPADRQMDIVGKYNADPSKFTGNFKW